ncbi:MAG: AAA family ATPase [Alphaproteobacteria bacterium]|nr:AAA family ATPase [Alphaproteobacteria bacterium]MDD9920493.1 AAA family ATPase [Alphaproteobacteria bacterium]
MSLAPLVGHTEVQKSLTTLAEEGRFPHAVLLHGPQGVGKRLLAETIGRYLLCGGNMMSGRIMVNENHVLHPQIEAGACPDYLLLEKAEGDATIKVDAVRNLLEKLSLTSDGRRVVIVDAADDLGVEAANAILKTLEEPGVRIHFILVAHNLFRLLPTILSRCRKMRVGHLNEDETIQVLQRQDDIDAITAAELAKQANGSPGEALKLGQEGLEIQQEIQSVLRGELQASAVADKRQQSKQVGTVFSLLLQELASTLKKEPTFSIAETYEKVSALYQRSQTHNLTGNWVLEEALHLAQASRRLGS